MGQDASQCGRSHTRTLATSNLQLPTSNAHEHRLELGIGMWQLTVGRVLIFGPAGT